MISDEYAAGFFDGEGSVYASVTRSANRKSSSPTLLVNIGNTDLCVLEKHKERWGGSIYKRGGKHLALIATGRIRQQYTWTLAARMAKPFLLAIFPHVIIKHDIVAVALQYACLMETPRAEMLDYSQVIERRGRKWVSSKTRPEFRAKVIALHSEIRRLNSHTQPMNKTRIHAPV